MSIGKWLLAFLGKLTVVAAVGVAFLIGVTGTIYLSLKSPEVKVPEIVGKDMISAEEILNHSGLNIRKRTSRFSPGTMANVVLDQIPKAGEVVKEGQTVAVVVSRAAMEGESQTQIPNASDSANKNQTANDNSVGDNNSSDENKPNRNKNRNSNLAKNAAANKNGNIAGKPSNKNSAANANSNRPANRNLPTLDIKRRAPGDSPTPATRTNNNHSP